MQITTFIISLLLLAACSDTKEIKRTTAPKPLAQPAGAGTDTSKQLKDKIEELKLEYRGVCPKPEIK